ncbi:MAG: DNA repair protein RecO [Myxococcales bacterium]|nr:DNA repair protein RecO [Myxococcales bacterium]
MSPPPSSVRAVILRTSAYREADLIVDLLTEERGRLAVLARGARSSRRRFGGALEIGTRLTARLSASRGLPALADCDLDGVLNAVRGDLQRIAHLSYVLEIARIFSKEGEADAPLFGLVTSFIGSLEAAAPSDEALALWELATLAHLGYGLRLGACVVTGGPADAISLAAGGAVSRQAAADAEPVPPGALAVLARLGRGDTQARFADDDVYPVRRALARTWARLAGRPLRSAPFLLPPDPV